MKEAVAAAYPQTELQRCIVHQVRNTLKYVGEKNKKEFANDLKAIYQAPSEKTALEQLERVTAKWEKDYPNAMKSRHTNRDVISPIFKFSAQVRKVIYTTNAIESLNSGYRRLNKQRSVFPSNTALLKALYPATTEISKKWTMPLRDWGKVLGELEIMFLQSFFRRAEFFSSVEHFILELTDYIDWYNNKRIKLKFDGLSPVEYRHRAA